MITLGAGLVGYATGISTAAAAGGPRILASATEGDLHAVLHELLSGAAALSHGAGQGVGLIGAIGAKLGAGFSFAFGEMHGDPAACASIQGIGFAVLGVVALLVVALARMRMAAEHRRLDVARRLIEHGLPVPDGLVVAPARRDLRRGIVLLCTGIGVCVAGLMLGDRGLGATGLVPAFIGVGYLIAYRLAVGEALVPDPLGPRSPWSHGPPGPPLRGPAAAGDTWASRRATQHGASRIQGGWDNPDPNPPASHAPSEDDAR